MLAIGGEFLYWPVEEHSFWEQAVTVLNDTCLLFNTCKFDPLSFVVFNIFFYVCFLHQHYIHNSSCQRRPFFLWRICITFILLNSGKTDQIRSINFKGALQCLIYYRAPDRVRKKIKNYAEIFGIVCGKMCWLWRKNAGLCRNLNN